MATDPVIRDTAVMDEENLMSEAERMALETFGEHAEVEHIEAMFERLTWCTGHGQPARDAVTVH